MFVSVVQKLLKKRLTDMDEPFGKPFGSKWIESLSEQLTIPGLKDS